MTENQEKKPEALEGEYWENPWQVALRFEIVVARMLNVAMSRIPDGEMYQKLHEPLQAAANAFQQYTFFVRRAIKRWTS